MGYDRWCHYKGAGCGGGGQVVLAMATASKPALDDAAAVVDVGSSRKSL
jgi:hypothetical protein